MEDKIIEEMISRLQRIRDDFYRSQKENGSYDSGYLFGFLDGIDRSIEIVKIVGIKFRRNMVMKR